MSPQPKKNRVVLGLMNFGPDVEWGSRVTSLPEFEKFLDFFQGQGYNEVDTARTYQNGAQEPFTAAAGWKKRGLKLATKLYPFQPGMHSAEKLTEGLNTSLKELQTSSVDIYYLHAPDRSVPFATTLEAANKLHQEGKFKELGLSNFTASEVAEIVVLCKERGWVRPTVYQAKYNALTRVIEPELAVVCKRYGINILAYNPLAGGFFTGKYKVSDLTTIGDGSLSSGTMIAKAYQGLYFNDAYFEALKLIEPVVKAHNLTMLEVALRWMVHHSVLDVVNGNDGVVIGVSTVEQLKGTLEDLEKGPLPKEVLDVLDAGWNLTKGDCKPYWHGDLKYTYDFDA